MWGEKIKIKHLVISLMLLCLVMLSAGAAFAASDDAALSEASGDIAIEDSSLSVSVLSTSDDVVLAESDENVVTNDTFFYYFDGTGTLLSNVTSDELIFEGDFSDIGVDYIIIDTPIKFTGDGAEFDGVSFVINSDNVTVDGFTVTQTNEVSAFTANGVSNVTLSNNIIEYSALKGYDSYAVYVKLVDDFNLINNTIYYVGNTDGTVYNNAVRIEGDDDENNPVPSSNIVVSGNTFDISLPSVDVEYDWTTYEPTVYSEGIVFYYVENAEFVNNTVEVSYNDVVTAWGYDSLYAVSVKGNPYNFDCDVVCKNVVIADNNITIDGHSCAYAVFVGAENLTVAGNDIYSYSETYLAHGIDIDSNAVDVMVADNVIVAEAPLATYGICADGYMGPVTGSQYINNDITVTGYSSIGMKVVVDPSPVISDNTVVAEGNYTYGIIANNGVVSGNDVSALGSNTGSDATGDSYMQKNSVGISVMAADVVDNTVYSTNTGLNIVQKGGIDVEGNTIAVENNALIDSYGIYANVDDLAFTDNIITYVGYSNGTVVNNAVRIEGNDKKLVSVKNITFEGNTFDISIPSCDVEYDMTTYEPTVYSEGIVFYYVEDVEFVNNTVAVFYNDVVTAWGYDSLYAVSVKGIYDLDDPVVSKNVVIADNNIINDGHACAYAVFAGAENLTVSGNNITATSETYLAHGIDIDSNTVGAMVADNVIVAEAPLATYGICADGYMGPVADSQYINNDVTVIGYSSIGMKVVVDPSPVIAENTVVATGNYTYGIIANYGVVSGNDVSALGSNTGNDSTGDSYMKKNSVGISVRDTDVVENTVYSTDVGINVVGGSAVGIDKNIIEVVSNTEDINNHAIVATNVELTISNNNITYVGATAPKYDYATAKAYAVYVVNSTVAMENNTMDITVPSLSADWEEVPPGSWNYVRHAYTEGIVFDACDDSSLNNNNIILDYSEGIFGSIYVVDVLDSDNFTIDGNNITGTGEGYLYGIIFEGENFNIANNTIYAISKYYANGIDIEGTSNGVIDTNTIAAIADDTAYPIYGGMVGPVSCNITNNQIYGNAYFGVGIELGGEDVEINKNTIVLKGNHTIAVGVNVDNLVANGNTIISNATNTGNASIWDSIGTDTTGIKSKKGNAQITENFVSTTGEYAVIIADSEGTVNGNYLVADELLGDYSVNATVAAVYNNAPVSVVTNDTFFYYFDENGTLLSSVISEILVFEGDFGDLGVDYITVNAPITFTTVDAVMEGISFVIASDNVTVEGFTITQTNDVSAFSAYGVSNVTLSNNIIDYHALEGNDSYAVYAGLVENFNLINNTIYYVGNTDGTVVNNAVRIEGDDEDGTPATGIVVSGNAFDVEMPSVDVGYDLDTWASTVMNDAIVFYYVEDLEFVNNTVKVEYNDVTTAYGWDSMYAVSVRSDAYTFGEVQSSDVLIANNTIDIAGHSCVYPVYVCADDFAVVGNNITSTSETYLAHGIDVDGPSAVGTVAENTIVAEAPLATYGIYSYQYMGAIEDIAYCDNVIEVTGYSSAGMEIVECNPNIASNEITANGNYTYGIIASIRDEGIISGNEIVVLGSNVGSDATGDSLMPKKSMGISVKGDCLIESNAIASTDIGINLVEDGEITIDGNIIYVESNTEDIDNHAIVASEIDDLIISNNNITYVGATAPKENYTAAKAYAVYVVNSTVAMENNTMDITVPSLSADWEEVPPGSWNYVRHAYTEGIVFDACDDSSLNNNNITLDYSEGNYGSIYVVDVLDSDNFTIDGNKIIGTGETYLYGIIIDGENFNIANNTIYAISKYYAKGIDIEGTSNGVIDSNTIAAIADNSAYPIYGGMMGPVSCNITNNQIYGNAFFGVGIELGGEDVAINNNLIVLKGNYTIAVGVNVDNLVVSSNTLISNATNTGDASSIWDSIGTDTTGIKSKKGNAEITHNLVLTTGEYAVDIADSEGTVNNNYLVSDKYLGDASVYSTGDATVYDNAPIFVSDLEKVYKDGQTLNVTVVNGFGEYASNITLIATIGSDQFEATTDDAGQAQFIIDELTPGNYTAVIAFEDIYPGAVITANVVVTKADTVVDAENVTVQYKETDGKLVVTLTNVYGTPLNGANVVVNLNGEDYALKTNSKGQVKVSTVDLPIGEYIATISYAGNSKYNPSNTTANVVVNKANMIISAVYDGENNRIVATLTNNATGNPIIGAKLNVDINGVNTTVKSNNKGKAVISTADLPVGAYSATISHGGNDVYNPASTIIDFAVKDEMIISAVYDSVNNRIVATLTNNNTGKVVMNANVVVDINGVNTTVKSNNKGKVVISTADLPKGEYTATISYVGNDRYDPVSTSVDFSTKDDMIISDIYGSATELVATLTNGVTGKAVSNANVAVDIDGVSTTVKSNIKGKIKVPIANLTGDTYTATISYRGNGVYNTVSTTTTVDLAKANMIIAATYDADNKQIAGTLTNGNTGKVITNANVKIELNGVSTTVKSNAKGQITVSTADLDNGTYTAVLSYQGNTKYNPSSTVVKVDA